MRLEAVTAVLRPRNPWEATDLGVALARRWIGPLYGAWFSVALPLFVLLHLLCWQRWWLIPWLLWWLKPLLDRAPLYLLSHVLFGDLPSLRRIGRALPLVLRQQALAALLWRRFDLARSFTLPISQLEHLRGKARRQRQRTLGQPGRGPAVWLTVICAPVEIGLDLALIALVWMLIPDFVALDLLDLFSDDTALGQLCLNLVGFCGMSLVEPFYVAAGFALYLKRRTELEAWDLELGFRQLAARLERAGRVAADMAPLALALLIGTGLLALPMPGLSAEPIPSPCTQRREREMQLAQAASPVQQALAETLREPELQICAVQQRWHWRETDQAHPVAPHPESHDGARLFAALIELLLWCALGVGAALFGGWLWRQAPGTLLPRRRTVTTRAAPLRTGYDALLLPPDAGLGATAWQLWQNGQARAALRLLYQGSLAGLASQYGIILPDSATEDESLRLITAQLGDAELLDFYRRLIRAWQLAAYGHYLPDAREAAALCAAWPRHFAMPVQQQPV